MRAERRSARTVCLLGSYWMSAEAANLARWARVARRGALRGLKPPLEPGRAAGRGLKTPRPGVLTALGGGRARQGAHATHVKDTPKISQVVSIVMQRNSHPKTQESQRRRGLASVWHRFAPARHSQCRTSVCSRASKRLHRHEHTSLRYSSRFHEFATVHVILSHRCPIRLLLPPPCAALQGCPDRCLRPHPRPVDKASRSAVPTGK